MSDDVVQEAEGNPLLTLITLTPAALLGIVIVQSLIGSDSPQWILIIILALIQIAVIAGRITLWFKSVIESAADVD